MFFNRDCSITSLGKIKIGNDCIFGENVKIYDHNHRTDATKGPFRKQGYVIGRVEIGSNVWIGSDVLILPNIRIGDNVIIAAGAIVTKDIPDNVTYIQRETVWRCQMENNLRFSIVVPIYNVENFLISV